MIDIYFGGAEDDTYEYCDKGSTMKKCAMINGSTINLPKNTLTYKNYFLKGWTTKKGHTVISFAELITSSGFIWVPLPFG
mgnify:CR=1 FL=1